MYLCFKIHEFKSMMMMMIYTNRTETAPIVYVGGGDYRKYMFIFSFSFSLFFCFFPSRLLSIVGWFGWGVHAWIHSFLATSGIWFQQPKTTTKMIRIIMSLLIESNNLNRFLTLFLINFVKLDCMINVKYRRHTERVVIIIMIAIYLT